MPRPCWVDTVDTDGCQVYSRLMDSYAALREGISRSLAEFDEQLFGDATLREQFEALSDEDAMELGHRALRSALAPILWGAAIGERWDVRRTTEFLSISRQALYKKLRAGAILGLRGNGTTWFPIWQFDPELGIVRSVTSRLLALFREADSDVDPLVIAAWATKDQALLDGRSPAQWLATGGDDETLLVSARRASAGLRA